MLQCETRPRARDPAHETPRTGKPSVHVNSCKVGTISVPQRNSPRFDRTRNLLNKALKCRKRPIHCPLMLFVFYPSFASAILVEMVRCYNARTELGLCVKTYCPWVGMHRHRPSRRIENRGSFVLEENEGVHGARSGSAASSCT